MKETTRRYKTKGGKIRAVSLLQTDKWNLEFTWNIQREQLNIIYSSENLSNNPNFFFSNFFFFISFQKLVAGDINRNDGEGEGFTENPNLVGMHTCCLFVPAYLESGLFSRWTARGTKVNPRVWRRPKLMDEGEESEVLNLETAETSPSMDSFSTSINDPSSLLWVACLRCLCFLDGRAFLKNSNEVGNLCLSTRCCCRLL